MKIIIPLCLITVSACGFTVVLATIKNAAFEIQRETSGDVCHHLFAEATSFSLKTSSLVSTSTKLEFNNAVLGLIESAGKSPQPAQTEKELLPLLKDFSSDLNLSAINDIATKSPKSISGSKEKNCKLMLILSEKIFTFSSEKVGQLTKYIASMPDPISVFVKLNKKTSRQAGEVMHRAIRRGDIAKIDALLVADMTLMSQFMWVGHRYMVPL